MSHCQNKPVVLKKKSSFKLDKQVKQEENISFTVISTRGMITVSNLCFNVHVGT